MGAIGKEIVRRLAGVIGLTLAALALTASAAAAAGTVSVDIEGAGAVGGSGIDCVRDVRDKLPTGTCAAAVPDGEICDPITRRCIRLPASASLAARPASGFGFERWSGGCTGADPGDCSLLVPRDVAVTAHFRDIQAPSVTLGRPGAGPVAGTISLAATANDNVNVARVEFRVRGALVGTDTSAPFTAGFNTKSIADGTAGVTATALDAAGNSASTSTVNVTIDNTAPTLGVAGPSNQVFGPDAGQSWTLTPGDAGGSGLAQVRCSVVAAGEPAGFGACSGGNGAHSVAGRPEGAHRLTVRAVDGAGNTTDVVRDFTVDATAPDTAIDAGLADGATTTDTSLTWALSAGEPGASFECRVYPAALTPGAFGPCSSGGAHTASGFAPGTYAFEARATDAVGNVDASAVKRTFTVATPGASSRATTAAAPQILVTLAFNFRNSTRTSTELANLVVKNVPAGATVTATCKGCSKRSLTKRNARGQVSLAALIKKALKVNATIRVTVSKPGSSSAVKILKIRARKAPLVSTRCRPEGAPKPTSC